MTRYYVIRHPEDDGTPRVVMAAESDIDMVPTLQTMLPIFQKEWTESIYVIAREVDTWPVCSLCGRVMDDEHSQLSVEEHVAQNPHAVKA